MSEIDLSQLTPKALYQLERDIRKERERRRREKQEMRVTTMADLANMDQQQIEHLEREAYPRKHWDTVEEAFEDRDTRLIAGIGEWTYDPELLTVTNENYQGYEIDLERQTTPAELLDTILQFTTKGFWTGSYCPTLPTAPSSLVRARIPSRNAPKISNLGGDDGHREGCFSVESFRD